MNIPIIPQDDKIPEDDQESCVFCNVNTIYWNEDKNRPVCPMCSVMYKPDDIDTAPYGY